MERNRLHKAFDMHRVSPDREFFRMDPSSIVVMIDGILTDDVTDQYTDPAAKD